MRGEGFVGKGNLFLFLKFESVWAEGKTLSRHVGGTISIFLVFFSDIIRYCDWWKKMMGSYGSRGG